MAENKVNYGDKIAARRSERAYGALSPQERDLADLKTQVEWAAQMLQNLRGEKGIDVNLPIISFNRQLVQSVAQEVSAVDTSTLLLVDQTEIDGFGVATYNLQVTRGQVAYQTPVVFNPGDTPIYKFVVSGDGEVYAQWEFTPSTGVIGLPTIEHAASTPASTSTTKRITIGSWHVNTTAKTIEVHNDRYGPIDTRVCRLAAEPTKTYSVTPPG